MFANSDLGRNLIDGQVQVPPPRALPRSNIMCHCFIIADGGFPLKTYLMKPYLRNDVMTVQQQVFNLRLSHARRIIESAFGLLTGRWLVHGNALAWKLSTVEIIIMCTICIHNFMITSELDEDVENRRYRLSPEEERRLQNGLDAANEENDEVNMEAFQLRQTLSHYLASPEGSIPWQWDRI